MNVVVVSPHLDDGVLSLGATINKLVRQGYGVKLVTVFAGDPDNDGPPSIWDARRGMRTAAEVVAARRSEDASAAAVLGIETAWLPFDDDQYLKARDPDAIWRALEPHLVGAESIFIPGWPLSHYDHRYTTMLALERFRAEAALSLYCELPYAVTPINRIKALLRGRTVPLVEQATGVRPNWSAGDLSRVDMESKLEALACYAGELAVLNLNLKRSPTQRRAFCVERLCEVPASRNHGADGAGDG